MNRLLLLVVFLAAFTVTSRALAVVPQTMSYQGVLTEGGGSPVPDGSYDLTFTLYDAPTGGTALWTEAQTAIPVTSGGFSVLLGSTAPLTLPFDAPYYLGISVGLDPEMEPRVPLAASPYGLGLRLPFSGSTTSAGSAVTIDNSGGGPELVLTGTSGDASVVLPGDAVSSTETLDEPGVAGATSDASTGVNTSLTALLSRTITVPAAGYVLAIGTCDLTFFHSVGTVDNMFVGVSTSPSAIPANHDISYSIGSAMSGDLYTYPITIQGLFPVSAGAQTLYFLARRTGGGVIATDKQLTLMYFPTAYGTVSAASGPPVATGAEAAPAPTQGLSAADIEEERADGARFNEERLHRELEILRAQLRSIEDRLGASGSAKRASGARATNRHETGGGQ